ncbi:2TM domain-containing protein [Lentiprolixibacter aurantiacus]|uniref:2TM domain-containing protein n=1 Tax=Lentiprolixibacter aurantiacus TaxID=2993939 RepID=A0AAE3MNT4_9FLAO|nr:2TM domain-containing protein [Lentiprolixibacter aurantiacus]MCX2720279.1 2TM domain-containing protein [Lentiprolixibacter aurantiacus]
MERDQQYRIRFDQARKRVQAIKDFFNNVRAFLSVFVILAVLYLFKVEPFILIWEVFEGKTLMWIEYNILAGLGIWALVLVIQGLAAFKYRSTFLRKWEERQIQKILREEQ